VDGGFSTRKRQTVDDGIDNKKIKTKCDGYVINVTWVIVLINLLLNIISNFRYLAPKMRGIQPYWYFGAQWCCFHG
jgi:hypothetical protein